MTGTDATLDDGGDGHEAGAAVVALQELTHLLRRECPWDREQTAGTIVPHTVEEAYEVADAARKVEAGDAPLSELEDELGDLLFQVCFLAMLCNEQDAAVDLASVARNIHAKLVRRHPHVFGSASAQTADQVRTTWERVKRTTERRGLFEGIPQSLPALTLARKVQARAAGVGFDFTDIADAVSKAREELGEVEQELRSAAQRGTLPAGEQRPVPRELEHEIGDLLFAAVNLARLVRADPELALRDASSRFRARVEGAAELAGQAQEEWEQLPLERQEHWYQQAKARHAAPS